MLWHVRALLEDRPGALASLAASCGDRLVNILGLQVFPATDGRVVDELVLHTPGGWKDVDVELLCAESGAQNVTVSPCSPHALEDQPVRYMRAAQALHDRPDLLEEQLCALLDAVPSDGSADGSAGSTLELDDDEGPVVRLFRPVAFTDSEVARASELRRLAARTMTALPEPLPAAADGAAPTAREARTEGPRATALPLSVATMLGEPALRRGTPADADAVVALHERCSAQTVYRRYHAPLPRVSTRFARSLLQPAGGLSLVLTVAGDVVGLGVLADGSGGPELGLMIEDGWQRRGLGSRLLRALAQEAADRGTETVTCLVQPDNDAVLPTIDRAQLRARVSRIDGLTVYRIPVGRLRQRDGSRRRGRSAMGELTTPLVALLHGREELREIYPAADLIDQAVRGGA